MFYIIAFIFGTIFGSFISVLVHRIYFGEKGIFLGRSKCPKCGHTLSGKDLVPIFSYIFLKGKCRYCKAKIPSIYPILEIITGLTFVFITYLVLGTGDLKTGLENISLLIYAWLIGIFIVAIAFYDILFYEISFILAGILGVLILLPQIFGYIGDIKLALIFAIISFLVFVSISFLRKKIRKIEGLGGGDAIGAALIGALTPILIDLLNIGNYPHWLILYVILLLGFLIAGIFSVFGLLYGKISNTKTMLPFLPFMFLAIVFFVFFGKFILDFIML